MQCSPKLYHYDDGSDIPDEYYVLGWDRNDRELCTSYGSRLTSREDYIQKCTQAVWDISNDVIGEDKRSLT